METELDVINEALASTGLAPVGSMDSKHPAFLKAKGVLDRVTARVQNKAYWFNSAVRVLTPGDTGEIVVPSMAATVDVLDSRIIVTRGTRLYNIRDRTYVIGEPVTCRIIERLVFNDTPYLAREFIAARTVFEYYMDEDGSEPKLSNYRNAAAVAYALLDAECIRHNEYNIFDGEHMQSIKYPSVSSRRVTVR